MTITTQRRAARVWKRLGFTALFVMCAPFGAWTQPIPEPVQYPINTGWFPKTISYVPDESKVVVTACTDTWKSTKPQRCTVMRYRIAEERWKALPKANAETLSSA